MMKFIDHIHANNNMRLPDSLVDDLFCLIFLVVVIIKNCSLIENYE